MTSPEIRVFVTLLLLLILPGWAFLSLTRLGRNRPIMQIVCFALGISIAFYPILFYWMRTLAPSFSLGPRKLAALLVLFAILALVDLIRSRFKLAAFVTSDWIAFGIFAVTLFYRLWMAHQYPYPAWADSLHHTLITQLTAQAGRLPTTMVPYGPIPLDMYHLGLYAISGPAQMLANVPAHTALLWTVQFLNAFCVIGVFMVLDSRVGRKAALIGSVTVGLLSFQPAWYFNWGRDTQISSQAILLIGWLVTWEAIHAWAQPGKRSAFTLVGLTLASALLSAGIFEMHFRVAGFYLPLLFLSAAWELYQAVRCKTARRAVTGTLVVGLLSIVLVMPVLIEAMNAYLRMHAAAAAVSSAGARDNSYFSNPDSLLFSLGIQSWLFYLTILSTLVVLLRRNGLGILVLIWTIILFLEGHIYALNIPVLNFTNNGAVMILYYMPFSLLIGVAGEEIFRMVQRINTPQVYQAGLAVLLTAGIIMGHIHATSIEGYRFFVTQADVAAMDWINSFTPRDSLFAVNTDVWIKTSAFGTDGGYWIPYFTGRQTNAAMMIYTLGSREYQNRVSAVSMAVKHLQTDPGAINNLCQMGVDYIYLGANTAYPARLTPQVVDALPGVKRVYDSGGVAIYQTCVK